MQFDPNKDNDVDISKTHSLTNGVFSSSTYYDLELKV